MKEAERTALFSIPIAVLAGAGLAWAGSQGGTTVLGGVPLFAFCVGLAFLIQWLAFIPAYLLQTERFYDLSGGLTYVSVTLLAVLLGPAADIRSILLLSLWIMFLLASLPVAIGVVLLASWCIPSFPEGTEGPYIPIYR